MLINRVYRGTSFCALVLVLGAGAAHAENFAASQTSRLDVPQVLNSSAIDVEFEEAKIANPGERSRFHLSFTNEGDVPAENIVLLMPVPSDVDVVSGTASDARAVVTYSVDGGLTFSSAERLLDSAESAEGETQLANVTTVRWTLTDPVPPGASGALSYVGVFH